MSLFYTLLNRFTMQATIKQVAQRAGVSIATVSYVLNGTGAVTDETRQRVLDAVAELNYQPRYAARSLRGRSYTLGVTLPSHPGRLAEPALAEVLSGLADAAASRGYFLLLATADADQDETELCLSLARTKRVDGLVLLDPLADDPRARALAAAGIPHVCAGPPPAGIDSPAVVIDVRAAAVDAVQHLLSLGHRRIGLIQLPSELAVSEPMVEGYRQALTAAGLSFDPTLVVESGRAEEDGYQAMTELLAASRPPTAVLAGSDELAFGAMHALNDARLIVGRDVALVGFDDLPLAAHVNPPLTTVRQPRRAQGQQLAVLLDDAILKRNADLRTVTLRARLIVRQSSGPALRAAREAH
ncbi:MAG: LacI family transcriptional regulator [Roseiflexus sp.]|nr:LacI family transcriptional regulator [Roseiflexus sp.]MCS7290690.1 LacI family transcriptional regulator [Roseiflexus sp.]MDW8232236.1 LacI family DNA-binding transcriptional regulator [Roseiflexaceae bacterium]